GARNVISGNNRHGVLIEASVSEPAIADAVGETASASLTIPSSNIRVQGNLIGTDFNGTASLENLFDGVHIDNSSNNTIGAISAFGRNVISGNGESGVFITNASGNVEQGIYSGADLNGPTS